MHVDTWLSTSMPQTGGSLCYPFNFAGFETQTSHGGNHTSSCKLAPQRHAHSCFDFLSKISGYFEGKNAFHCLVQDKVLLKVRAFVRFAFRTFGKQTTYQEVR